MRSSRQATVRPWYLWSRESVELTRKRWEAERAERAFREMRSLSIGLQSLVLFHLITPEPPGAIRARRSADVRDLDAIQLGGHRGRRVGRPRVGIWTWTGPNWRYVVAEGGNSLAWTIEAVFDLLFSPSPVHTFYCYIKLLLSLNFTKLEKTQGLIELRKPEASQSAVQWH